jgi:hypothetical protein
LVLAAIVVLVAMVATAFAGFKSPRFFPATGTSLYPVAIADLNRDGRKDIVVGSEDNDTVSILYGKRGGFKAPHDYPGGDYPFWISLADFDHDHRPDIAVADDSTPGTVTVLLSKRSGGFALPDAYDVGDDPVAMGVADFNRDGNKDLAIVEDGPEFFSLLLGRDNGTFSGRPGRATGNNPVSIVAADLNRDGKKDVAVLDNGGDHSKVKVFQGKGNAYFRPPQAFDGGALGPYGMATGQFTRDRRLDLVVPDCQTPNRVYLLAAKRGGGFKGPRHFANDPGSCTYVPAVADLNRDGHPDLATAIDGGSKKGKISVLNGKSRGRLGPPHFFNATGTHSNYSIAAARLNKDPRPDLVVPDYDVGRVGVLYGKR